MRRFPVLLLIAIIVSGCATSLTEINRRNRTTFEPMADGSFRMTVLDNPAHLLSAADHVVEWANAYVSENNLCLRGHTMEEMQKIVEGDDLFGKFYRRHYIIRCK